MNIGSLEVRNTKDLFNRDTRFCNLVFSEAKRGKTTLAGSLDRFTRKYRGKPTLFIACEAADGGGTATIEEMGVDYVIPTNHGELKGVIDALKSDTKYGGVVFDNLTDAVEGIIKPYSLTFPSKEGQAVRAMGVPDRGDYQSMGEFLRQQLAPLVALTRHKNPDVRKDIVCCALVKEKMDKSGKAIEAIQPALPGAMSTTATAMFQTVSQLTVRARVVPNPDNPKENIRIYQRVLISDSDGVVVAGDRWKVMPREFVISSVTNEPIGFTEIYEQLWVPKLVSKEKEVGSNT